MCWLNKRRGWMRSLVLTMLLVLTCRAQASLDFVDFQATWSSDPNNPWQINKNVYGYDSPQWDSNHFSLTVDNEYCSNWEKEMWVTVDWSSNKPSTIPNIQLTDPNSGFSKLVTTPSESGNGWTWHWVIRPQPAEESLLFPNTSFWDLQNIQNIQVSTYCATKTVHKGQYLYGNLNQHDIPADSNKYWLADPNNLCGPTSVVNSMVYLEKVYPIYGRKLIPDTNGNKQYDKDELINVAKTLADPNYMDANTRAGGTYADMLIYGKHKYIEEKEPNITIYGAQDPFAWDPNVPDPIYPWVRQEKPSWDWLYQKLITCEDIEFLVNYPDPNDPNKFDGGHYLTLTSFDWKDNGNSVLDPNEAKLDFIDPWTGQPGECGVWSGSDGFLKIDYSGGASITVAVEETPEPATLSLSLLALGWVVLRRRRHNAQ